MHVQCKLHARGSYLQHLWFFSWNLHERRSGSYLAVWLFGNVPTPKTKLFNLWSTAGMHPYLKWCSIWWSQIELYVCAYVRFIQAHTYCLYTCLLGGNIIRVQFVQKPPEPLIFYKCRSAIKCKHGSLFPLCFAQNFFMQLLLNCNHTTALSPLTVEEEIAITWPQWPSWFLAENSAYFCSFLVC